MKRQDFLLIAINAAGVTPLTPVQLQKAMFLIFKAALPELPKPFYEFKPYNYGPFCKAIYEDAGALHREGLVHRFPSSEGNWLDTVITPLGQKRAVKLELKLSKPSRDFVHAVLTWVQAQSFSVLVRKIYELYPEFQKNSVFQEA
ncbi:MAG: hypothetical protein HYY31_06960 [Chloroflexi bacterium]|nr:hypothetical protein [Chloroflexota bacterium]